MVISVSEYQQRRTQLAIQMAPGSVALIPAATEILRNGDNHYRFRQDSNFWYLTGYNESEALLVILAGEEGRSLLFNRPKDPSKEKWEGKRLGQDEAISELGMQEAHPIGKIKSQLLTLLQNRDTVYYPMGLFPKLEQALFEIIDELKHMVRKGISVPSTLKDVVPLLSEQRVIKSAAEIALMRKAAEISANAHKRAMQVCTQVDNEGCLEAELCYEFIRHGCKYVAYPPIVGSGENSCTLHYGANNTVLKKGELVLIDAGGEFHNYASDISRTFPINGVFSESQRTVYEWVLKAQRAGIACVKPGVPWVQVQETIVGILTQGLCEMGILKGELAQLIADNAYLPYYMHNSGHWLGLDVHDCGAYKIKNQWRTFEPGMVLTVEPGLYLSSLIPGLEARWHGIGVRIEDDIGVTKDGHENLSGTAPVDIDDIEALMGGRGID